MGENENPKYLRVPLRAAKAAAAVLAITVATAVVLMWPDGVDAEIGAGFASKTEKATVEGVERGPCPPPQPGQCVSADVRLESGSDEGSTVSILLGDEGLAPDLSVGDSIRVFEGATADPSSAGPATGPGVYTFADFERRMPLGLLALAFVGLVVVFGRRQGLRSLLGLAISLLVIVIFMLPALLDRGEPLLIALVGSLAVMLITISLAHGLGPKSIAAMLGTALCLLLVAGLALAAIELTHLTGLASEEATLLNLNVTEVSLQGLLIAGMVIGALGVLDDLTVSQSSTVFALRLANPELGFGELYRRAALVGRDHVSATVNTLVLAYVGSSLPILLLFTSGSIGLGTVINSELVATEIVAMLVGSIGLIAAVPLTTALAAGLAQGAAPAEIGEVHAHAR